MLVVCTGNVCRSPMAAALLDRHFQAAGISALVASAGLLDEGSPACAGAVGAMAAMGLDLTAHRSRRLQAPMCSESDLILGMAAEHVRESAVLVPSTWPRAFTLKELVRRAALGGGRQSDETLGQWLGRMHEGREAIELLGPSSDNDIADPFGMGERACRTTARELDRLVAQLVALGWA